MLTLVTDYKIKVTKIGLPCINLGTRDAPVWTPPELLYVIPGQPFMSKLNEDATSKMIQFACKSPKENAESIQNNGIAQLGLGGRNDELVCASFSMFLTPPLTPLPQSPFKMGMEQEMVVVPGRILPAPGITYAAGGKTPFVSGASWNLAGVKFARAAALKTWSCLVIQDSTRTVPKEVVTGLLTAVMESAKSYGMTTSPVLMKLADGNFIPVVNLPREKGDTKALIDALSPGFARFVQSKVQIVYVLLPSKDKSLYSAVKYCGDVKFGVATVCSNLNQALNERGQAQYLANVMLKFNIKLGGINHNVQKNVLGPFGDGKTMLVGCDVTHPSPGSLKGVPSVAGVVASVDPGFIQFPGSLRLQTGKQEMIDGLDEMFAYHLKMWYDRNGNKYPERIIVYRDGVSEGITRLPSIMEPLANRKIRTIRARLEQGASSDSHRLCQDSRISPENCHHYRRQEAPHALLSHRCRIERLQPEDRPNHRKPQARVGHRPRCHFRLRLRFLHSGA